MNRPLAKYSNEYEKFFLSGDLNASMNDSFMKEFCSLNLFKNLINKPICVKNSKKPSCTDLILTNLTTYFQDNIGLDTGFSDFHSLTVAECKISFQKYKPHNLLFKQNGHIFF